MLPKELIGGIAALLGIIASSLYVWQILKHGIRPHIFSRIVWGILMLIAFAAQVSAGAGPGSWTMGISALICFIIAGLGFFYGEKSITRNDWASFIFSLSAIPVWMATHNPLWAVIIVSAIDAVAYYPTFRKSWVNPYQESLTAFFIYTLQMSLSLAALDSFTLTTALYPATLVSMNVILVFILLYRRKART